MQQIREYLNSVQITFESWLAGVVGLVLLRTFFEQYSSVQTGRFALIDFPTLVHYTIFYIATLFTLMIILFVFSNENKRLVFTVATLGLPIILLPPILDLLTAGLGGRYISYIFTGGHDLLIRFLTFFGGHFSNGITLGIQIETVLGMIFCFTLVYFSNKNIWKALAAGIVFYITLFFFISVPSITSIITNPTANVSNTITQSIFASRIITDNIHPSFGATEMALMDIGFNKLMTAIFTIISSLAVALFFFLTEREKFISIIKNSRPERIFHFFLLFLFGSALVSANWFNNWIDVLSYLLTFGAFKAAWMFSVCQNDIYDEHIDSISNPDRPLITNGLSKNDQELASKIFIFFAFLCAYSASNYALFFVTMFTLVYFIYSNPPFRFKRFVLVNSFLVSLACLAVIMSGFFAVSNEKNILSFPPALVLSLIIFFTAVTNIRDIKDVDGDKADGIKTLPVLLGLKNSKKLIAGVIGLFFLVIPWYFKAPNLYIPGVVAAITLWYFTNKKNYIEWKGFVAYMLYLILLIITLMSK